MGGHDTEFDDFPMDRVLYKYEKNEMPIKVNSELQIEADAQDHALEIYKATFTSTIETLRHLVLKLDENPDIAEDKVHGKYTIVEMINQLRNVLRFMQTHSGIIMEATDTLPLCCWCLCKK